MEKLNQALSKARDFIQRLEDLPEDDESPVHPEIMFSIQGEGTVLLGGELAQGYRETVAKLREAAGKKLFSRHFIESEFRKAIFSGLDLQEKNKDVSFEVRLKTAIGELRETLSKLPKTWEVYCQVSGVASPDEPISFGVVHFVRFDEAERTTTYKWIAEGLTEALQESTQKYLGSLGGSGETVAVVVVQTSDARAAQEFALEKLRQTVDVLNFYSDMLETNWDYRVTLPGETSTDLRVTIVTTPNDRERYSFMPETVGARFPLNLKEITSSDPNVSGIDIVQKLLSKQTLNEYEGRLLTAIQWAGKATVESRVEESFLYYAIALESLVMPRSAEADIGYRLRLFVPHLLQRIEPDKRKVEGDIRRLYNIRSAIVHQGKGDIADTDLRRLRRLTKYAILTMLTKEPFTTMTKHKDLEDWLQGQALGIASAGE